MHLERLNLAGIIPTTVEEGSVESDQWVIGEASLPLSERFFVNVSVMFART